jgi:PBP1b-binding outer membrane lipoprotein LpoB
MKYTLIAFLLLSTLIVTWCASKTPAPDTDTAIVEEDTNADENDVDDTDDDKDDDAE